MTFNIWNYNAPWTARRELIARLIEAEAPDVVALQETRHDWRYERGRGQGDQIAQLTGYHPTFSVTQVFIPILRIDEGLTVLTPQPPASHEVLRLTMFPHLRDDHDQRICLGVTLDQAGSRVHIVDTHFSLDPIARVSNAREAAQFVRRRAGSEPAVLMGDLNAEPQTPPIQFLTGQTELEGESADFLDCWTAANGSEPGHTYASFDPVRRIDYVLARNVPSGEMRARTIGGTPVDGVYPSDHLGVVVELPI
jgi:endonuclease/exonuclease/phosphatase family metal-dependent hydrolase